MIIREATSRDFEEIWSIFHEIISKGDTYAYPPDTSKEDGMRYWCEIPEATFVVEDDGEILGTYYLKPNQPGLGSHVCNCGYMVPEKARGKGLATFMCEHSQKEAIKRGYRAMQFNLVVSSNENAIRLWKKLGFHIIGEIPQGFWHIRTGLINAYVMYKLL